LGFIFIILIWLSDLLDGYTARKRNEISELGKIIDPLADKIAIAGIVLVLLFKEIVPFWFVIIVIFRDLLILTFALYLKYRKNIVLQSDLTGKLTVFVIGFTMLIVTINKAFINCQKNYILENMELLINALLLLSIVMSGFSLVSYFNKFIKIIRN
jgi:CDP-diacylglycerol--glycerol-3-phosphate 3-phosphatidyltransferase